MKTQIRSFYDMITDEERLPKAVYISCFHAIMNWEQICYCTVLSFTKTVIRWSLLANAKTELRTLLFETVAICYHIKAWLTMSFFCDFLNKDSFRSYGPRQANLVLIAYASSESRGTFRQKARSLVPLNGWACAVMTECSKTQILLTGLT